MNKRYVRKNQQYRRNALTAALAVSLGFTGMAYGQSTTGSIFGTAPAAAGESVKVVSASGVTREVPVDSSGHYAANELAVGAYTVTLLNGGQVVSTQNNVQVNAGSGTAVSFNATSSADAKNLNAVNVVGNALPAIDISSVNASTTITSKDLQQLPLQHSAESIALLAPGTTPGSGYFGNAVSFGGSSVSENAYYVNGYNTGEPYRNIGGFALPYGAIDQQQTITNGYSAKYGRSDGGVINQLGKSGTNEWHFGGQVAWQPKFAAAAPKNTFYSNAALPSATQGIPDGTCLPNDPYDYYCVAPYSSADYPNGLPYVYANPGLAGKQSQYRNDNKMWETIYSAYFGGPLIKDKLFLFVAAEKTKDDITNVEASANDQMETYQDHNSKYYAKLDWNITDDHHLAFTYLQNSQSNGVDGAYYDYDSDTHTRGAYKSPMDTSKDDSKFYIGQYTGYFGDNASLNVLWGKGTFSDPVIYANHSSAPYIAGTTSCGAACVGITRNQTAEYWYAEDASNSTHALRADFTYHLGDHAIGVGIDNMHYGAHDQGQTTSGPGYLWNYISSTQVHKYIYDVQTSMTMSQKAFYAQDDWQISQDWLISLGIRNDHFTNYNNVGKAFVNEKNQWEPRLGVSWDVFGDSSFKVYANAGRYYLSLPDNAAERAANASTYTNQTYYYTGVNPDGTPILVPGQNPPAISADGEYGAPKNVDEVTAKNLRPEYMDEFLLGFDKKLGDNWVYGAMASYRNLKQAIDDECSPSQIATKMAKMGLDPGDYTDSLYGASYCRLINPGETNKMVVNANDGSGSVIVPMSKSDWGYEDGVVRKVFSVNMYLEHPFDGKWFGRLDYTFSNGRGNSEGQVRSDFGQADVSKTEDWDTWQLMEGQNGELLNNRKHSIRFRGAYQITPEWLVSANALIQSGMPEECLGFYGQYDIDDPSLYNGNDRSSYHWCGGKIVTPGFKHTPWTHQIDLGVHYRPSFADHKLSFNVDIFNVFNEQKALQTDPTFEVGINSNPNDPTGTTLAHLVSNTYGEGIYYEQPRYVRFSVNYDW